VPSGAAALPVWSAMLPTLQHNTARAGGSMWHYSGCQQQLLAAHCVMNVDSRCHEACACLLWCMHALWQVPDAAAAAVAWSAA
jgi:hypothetical protein